MEFWTNHGWLFLFGCMFFPRITLFFFSAISFGFWHWVGLIFTPHLMVAIIATANYWDANPVMCVFAWLWAFAGTKAESSAAKRATR